MHPYQIKSIELLLQKSGLAIEYATGGSLTNARLLIDEIRFLRAVFMQDLNAEQDTPERSNQREHRFKEREGLWLRQHSTISRM